MAVSRPETPDEMWRAFVAGVDDFLGRDSPLAQGIRNRSLRMERLQVFTLALQDVLNGEGVRAAKAAGWRVVTVGVGEVVASDVMEVPEKRMTSLSRDPRLASMLRVVHGIDDLPEVQRGGDYELRLLRIPAVLVDALWLQSKTNAGDLIIPVLSAGRELITGRKYEVDEFFEIVRPLAEGFREFDKRAG